MAEPSPIVTRLRRAYHKAVFSEVRMGRYSLRAADAVAPATTIPYRLEMWGPDRFDELLGQTPYVSASDLEHYRRQTTWCVVALDGEAIIACAWRSSGRVYLPEIDDYVDVPDGAFYGGRDWVKPEYRGPNLANHTSYFFSQQVDPETEVWGLMRYANEYAIRSAARIGYVLCGDIRVRWVLGTKHVRQIGFAPRPALDGDRIRVPSVAGVGAAGRSLARRAVDKLIFREVRLGQYVNSARCYRPPSMPCEYRIEIWGPDRYGDVLGTNPYLTASDVDHFRRQTTVCVVVLDQESIVASNWWTSGRVYVSEIDDYIDVPPGAHYSCRQWVTPDHRGKKLANHMSYAFVRTVGPEDEFWSHVRDDNEASLRSLDRIGYRRVADIRVRWIVGIKFIREIRSAPLPALDGDRIRVP